MNRPTNKLLISSFLFFLTSITASAQINININPKEELKTTDNSFGVALSESTDNFSAELVRNGDFQSSGQLNDCWFNFLSVTGNVKFSLSNDAPKGFKKSLHIKTSNIGDTDAGVQTAPYIPVMSTTKYRFTAWVKINRSSELWVMLKNEHGQRLQASERLKIKGKKGSWQKVETTLTPSASIRRGVLAISSKGNSDFLLAGVTLKREDQKGDFQPDVIKLLRELHPAFLCSTDNNKESEAKAKRLAKELKTSLQDNAPAPKLSKKTFGTALAWAADVVKSEKAEVSFGRLATPIPDLITDGFASPTPLYHIQKALNDNIGTKFLAIDDAPEDEESESQQFTPERSMVGVATSNATATFTDLTVTAGEQGFFASGRKDKDFNITDRNWESTRSGLKQKSDEGFTSAMATKAIEGRTYCVRVRTKKTGGNGGMWIIFNYADDKNYCTLQIDQQISIVQTTDGTPMPIGTLAGGAETDRWYDIRIDIEGNNISLTLDDQKALRAKLGAPAGEGIYYSAVKDEDTKEVILKIVNTGRKSDYARISFGNMQVKKAIMTEVAALSPDVENTFDDPDAIIFRKQELKMDAKYPRYIIDPYSLNILRIKLSD